MWKSAPGFRRCLLSQPIGFRYIGTSKPKFVAFGWHILSSQSRTLSIPHQPESDNTGSTRAKNTRRFVFGFLKCVLLPAFLFTATYLSVSATGIMSNSNKTATSELLEFPTEASDLPAISPDVELTAEQQQYIVGVVTFIDALELTKELRSDPLFKESRPHLNVPIEHRPNMLTAGSLAGHGRITVPPYVWTDDKNYSLVAINHLGRDVCGHPGIVHGGLLATLLDEGLVRCGSAALPNKVGVTASLNINYRAPVSADSYLVMRANVTNSEGRKAWVKGRLETLPAEGKEPIILVEAECLVVEPKWAAGLKKIANIQ